MASHCLQGLLPNLPYGCMRSCKTLLGKQGRSITRVSVLSTGNDLRLGLNDNPEGIISGEWPDNFSLLSFDDLRAYLEAQELHDNKMRPLVPLGEIMSVPVQMAMVDQTLEEVDHYFKFFSGIPVVDGELRCIGIVSYKDTTRASSLHGLKTRIGEVMSSPAITLTRDNTVKDAAALMLRMKINRIPIIDGNGRLVGIVTRTDIYEAMEA